MNTTSEQSSRVDELRAILQPYMEVYWLRPETALWRAADRLSLRELKLDHVDLDLGCGDGFNSYLLAGGKLPLEVDDFLDVVPVSAESFLAGKADLYDAAPTQPIRVDPPSRRIRWGLDWKQHLLDKARSLGLYENLIRHDANFPLPLPDGSVHSVFSNVLYWLERLELALSEIARVLTQDGVATVLVPDAALRDFYVYHRFVVGKGWDWMARLDMGRHTHIKHQYTQAEWERRFRAAGLRVKVHRAYLSSRIVEVSEIGLRPLSPVLIKMANRLSPADRLEIKREWVEYCMELAIPMFTSGWLDDPSLPRTFHAFVLERQL